ncbi:MAG TPA: DUF5683 domain-containing protein [Chitinophagaceae bacterium]|nr:DUF5683 domain-containing protein [Chitinophagaceae bacterium]HNU13698.1 DUF5683 domain-containing protein [Chitinophagaceae bacterium]
MRIVFSFVFFLILFSVVSLHAQEKEPVVISTKDSVPVIKSTVASGNRYDSALKAHSPKKAAMRSAILPGLGQIYNKKYWKLPIIYGALGTCTGIFLYNLGNYKDTRFAYRVKYNMRVNGTDSALFSQIKSKLKPLDEESLRYYRNQFRRDIDYSALFFILLWGLNVVDATVDAHLKSFDVSPELSLQFKPGYSELARTNGLSIVMKIGK